MAPSYGLLGQAPSDPSYGGLLGGIDPDLLAKLQGAQQGVLGASSQGAPPPPPQAQAPMPQQGQMSSPGMQAAQEVADYKPSFWNVLMNTPYGASMADARQKLIQQKQQDVQRHYAPAMMDYARNYIQQNIPDSDPRKAALMADPVNGFQALQAGVQKLSSEPVSLKATERQSLGGATTNAPTGEWVLDPASGRVINNATGAASTNGLGGRATMTVDGPSGKPVVFDPTTGQTSAGPSLGGDYKAADGLVVSGRNGVAGTYTQQQKLGPGEAPASYSPTFSGPGFQSPFPTSAPSGPLAPMISAAEAKYGLPAGMLSRVINIGEHSGQNAVSPKGALGVAQIMPGTARDLGVNPLDPPQAIDGAARYLAQNLKRFGGDPVKAIAAYNAGPGAVQKYGGVPPYKETQDYVSRVAPPGWTVGAPNGVPREATPQELAGYAPGTRGQMIPGKGLVITQNAKAAGNFNTQDTQRVAQMAKLAEQAKNVAALSSQFMQHYQDKGSATGPAYMPLEVPIPFGHGAHIPLNPLEMIGAETKPAIGAMKGLNSRMAPQLRPEGSGRIMGPEYANFLRAAPNIENMGETNARINTDIQSDAQRSADKAAFYRTYLQNKGNLSGVEDAYAERAAPAQQASSVKVRVYNPKTGNLE